MDSLKNIEKQAFELPENERAILALNLIRSLEKEEDSDVSDIWFDEAERRYQELKQGKVIGKTSKQVFEEARARIQ
jgi:Putative addiction module component